MGKFKRVCVFCGSSSGYRKIFSDAAFELGRELVGNRLYLCQTCKLLALDIFDATGT